MTQFVHEVLTVGPLQCNCIILGDTERGDAIVVDPGGEIDRIQERLAHHGLTVRAILHTHAHFDHVGSTGDLQKATGAPVYLHEGDLDLLQALGMQAQMFGAPEPAAVEVDHFLIDEQALRVGELRAGVLHTPGHTPGSLSFLVAGGPLISGDTLFKGSIGRSDLWGGSHEDLMRSIEARLLSLDDDTEVIPGHGPITTIGEEKRSNPFLRGLG